MEEEDSFLKALSGNISCKKIQKKVPELLRFIMHIEANKAYRVMSQWALTQVAYPLLVKAWLKVRLLVKKSPDTSTN
jgi:hypothetical protein